MADILHRVGATATLGQVYEALTSLDGLAAGGPPTRRATPHPAAQSSSDSVTRAGSP